MARTDSEKCCLCSKLSTVEAQACHRKTGDGCWEDQRCYNRRSYYRHCEVRNHNRKQKRLGE